MSACAETAALSCASVRTATKVGAGDGWSVVGKGDGCSEGHAVGSGRGGGEGTGLGGGEGSPDGVGYAEGACVGVGVGGGDGAGIGAELGAGAGRGVGMIRLSVLARFGFGSRPVFLHLCV